MKRIVVSFILGMSIMLPVGVFAHDVSQGRKIFYLQNGNIEVRRFRDGVATCYVAQQQARNWSGSNVSIDCVIKSGSDSEKN